LGVQSGVNQVHGPRQLIVPMHDGFPCREVDGEIIIDGIKVQKILFNDFCFIPQRNDEFIDALRSIDIHDVPQNWLAADFYHRLGTEDRFF
jgi:hypothetical protein